MSGSSPSTTLLLSGVLAGRTVVITRPVGTGQALSRQVRKLGGIPLLLPGLSLRSSVDVDATRMQWQQAQHEDIIIFTSPAAVRYALKLSPLVTSASIVATGQGTALALRRYGFRVHAPETRQDSEGVLALPLMQKLEGKSIALVNAPGGRGYLQPQLIVRGARLREVHVYRRVPARLQQRHINAVLRLTHVDRVLLSSGEALQNLMQQLPDAAQQQLHQVVAVVSSDRLAELAGVLGFSRLQVARSARPVDLLKAACSFVEQEP